MARHEPKGDQPYRKHDNDQHAGASPHARQLTIHAGGLALRLHNFQVGLISQPLGAYLRGAGRRRPFEATRPASRPPT